MKIELSNEQLQLICQVLEQAPFRLVAPILLHIQSEVQKNGGVVAPLGGAQAAGNGTGTINSGVGI